jgi:WD40 repeat protein
MTAHHLLTLSPDRLIAGRYRITAPIGAGGSGAVYAAVDTATGAQVALKHLLNADPASAQAFTREIALLRDVRHPHLPAFYAEVGDATGRFLVMEYIPGADLGALLARRGAPFEVHVVLGWAATLIDLLEQLHNRRPPIVHRDIKPQNLKLTPAGRLVLVDFGLARAAVAGRTAAPTVVGYTLAYAPLEQIRGGSAGPRDDIYALGATLYHLLAGMPPADALTRAAARLNGQPDPLVPLDALQPFLPRGVVAAVHAALALEIERRPASAAALRAALVAPPEPAPAAYTGATLVVGERAPSPARPALAPIVRVLLTVGCVALALALVVFFGRPFAAPTAAPAAPVVAAVVPVEVLDPALAGSFTPLPTLGAPEAYVERVAFSADGKTLAAAQADGRALLWNAQDLDAPPRVLEADRWRIEALAFAPDGAMLATGDSQGRVRLWRVADGSLVTTLRKHYQGVTAVQFAPNGRLLATASTDGAIRLWDLTTGQVQEREGYYNPATKLTVGAYSLTFTPDGTALLLGLGDGSIVLSDVATGRDMRRVEAHTGAVIGLTLSADGALLAGAGDRRIRLWRIADLTPAGAIEAADTVAGAAQFTPDGRFLAVATARSVTIWAADGRPVARLNTAALVQSVAFAPDGQTIAAATYGGQVQLWRFTPAP